MKIGDSESHGGYAFGTFQGVFTPSILTIIGVVMYLRFGWVLGNVGITGSLALVTIGSAMMRVSEGIGEGEGGEGEGGEGKGEQRNDGDSIVRLGPSP